MKIEKINDNQIRCTLTREDLDSRHIKLSELAYGSENAKLLFRDMMQQAAAEFGFEAEDIPLMIEAIPLSPETLMLIVTKVDSPEELDTRFSNFSDSTEDSGDEAGPDTENPLLQDHSQDILELFERIRREKEAEIKNAAASQPAAKDQQEQPREMVKMFCFRDLETAFHLSELLKDFYTGDNALYKDFRDQSYHLVIHQGAHSLSEFYKVYNTIAEYTHPENYTPGCEAYFREHSKVILPQRALQTLTNV